MRVHQNTLFFCFVVISCLNIHNIHAQSSSIILYCWIFLGQNEIENNGDATRYDDCHANE